MVGIVTEVGAKFNTAVPAVVVRFALDSWGVRLEEDVKPLTTRPTEGEPEPVSVHRRREGWCPERTRGLP